MRIVMENELNYKTDDLDRIYNDFSTIEKRKIQLVEKFVTHECKDSRSNEYMTHGFSRRISTLARCIDNIFSYLPPENNEVPEHNLRKDAEINLQAFVFNVYGAIDNLAHICVFEMDIRKSNGNELPASWIGFDKSNKHVRNGLSESFRFYLEGLDEWLDLQSDYRHALAHRIPLYIPSHAIPAKVAKKYEELTQKIAALQQEMFKNITNTGEFWRLSREREHLEKEQIKLAHFRPTMMHSFSEQAPEIIFHAQILADFRTVEEIATFFLGEISEQ